MENNNTKSSNTGAIIAKFVGMIFLVIVVGAVIYFIMQMTNQSPTAKAASEIFGAGAKLFLIPTEACTYATTCKGMGEPDCKNDDSDECAWDVNTKKCYNKKGRKPGTGGPTSPACWFGIGEIAAICATILSFLTFGLTKAGRKALANFFLNKTTKKNMTNSSSSPETVVTDAAKAGEEFVAELKERAAAGDWTIGDENIQFLTEVGQRASAHKNTYTVKSEKDKEARQKQAQEEFNTMQDRINTIKNNALESSREAFDRVQENLNEVYGVDENGQVSPPEVTGK